MNKFLEKIAELTDEEFKDIYKGTPTRLLAGPFGISGTMERKGYDAPLSKVLATNVRALDFSDRLTSAGIGAAAGAAGGALIAAALKSRPALGAGIGGYLGLVGGIMKDDYTHFTDRFPKQLRREINEGQYGKPYSH